MKIIIYLFDQNKTSHTYTYAHIFTIVDKNFILFEYVTTIIILKGELLKYIIPSS